MSGSGVPVSETARGGAAHPAADGVVDGDAGSLQRRQEPGRAARRSGDEADAAVTEGTQMASSRRNRIGRLTPNGALVRAGIFRVSAWQPAVSPDDVSMMPSPPALHTARNRAIHPIGASTIGKRAPVQARNRLVGHDFPLGQGSVPDSDWGSMAASPAQIGPPK